MWQWEILEVVRCRRRDWPIFRHTVIRGSSREFIARAAKNPSLCSVMNLQERWIIRSARQSWKFLPDTCRERGNIIWHTSSQPCIDTYGWPCDQDQTAFPDDWKCNIPQLWEEIECRDGMKALHKDFGWDPKRKKTFYSIFWSWHLYACFSGDVFSEKGEIIGDAYWRSSKADGFEDPWNLGSTAAWCKSNDIDGVESGWGSKAFWWCQSGDDVRKVHLESPVILICRYSRW